MNASIQLVSVFRKVRNEDGSEHFVGALNPKMLKKAGAGEVQVVLVPGEGMARGVMDLMKKGTGSADLLMFAESLSIKQDELGRRSPKSS